MEVILEELDNTSDYHQYCSLLQQLTTINPDQITQEQFNKQLAIIKSNPYHKIIIAKINGVIVGTSTVLIEPKIIHNLSRVAHIEDVLVDSNYRTCGIGSILMKKVIDISKEFNCYKIILDCSLSKIDFYKKFDFVVKETQMVLYLGDK